MKRWAAFLRGVMPTNAKMPALRRAFERAGFDDVKTVLGSGNVVFGAAGASEAALLKKAEAAMRAELGRAFPTTLRTVDELERLLASDPWASFRLAQGAKRVVTFLRERPRARPRLPLEVDGARILAVSGREVYTAYVRSPKGPVFMTLIEKTFGDDVTTRTWDTIAKVVKAA